MIEEGASVRERQLICRVVDPKEPLRVNAKFSEALVDQIKVGAKATIKVQATPNETYTGIVKSVAPMADTNALAQQNIKVYTTYIELDKGTLNLRPGMTASATVVLQERDNVLIVPIGALAKFPGMTAYQVDVKTADGKIESRSVVLGLQGGSMVNGKWRDKGMVEIKEGLKAGDKVLYTPESGFQ
jgi:multidrug efflux pump subunit AcrA (membrane-fusion protein)